MTQVVMSAITSRQNPGFVEVVAVDRGEYRAATRKRFLIPCARYRAMYEAKAFDIPSEATPYKGESSFHGLEFE